MHSDPKTQRRKVYKAKKLAARRQETKCLSSLASWCSPVPPEALRLSCVRSYPGRCGRALCEKSHQFPYSFSPAEALGLAPARAARKRSNRAALAAAQLFC
jgi:hypothetical protein